MPFTPEICAQLKHYVYRLIDPRNGETFYVGKGQNNRVFDHASADSLSNEEIADPSNKIRRIREILNANLEVIHVVHRHGMTANEAFQVEAALMDAYPGLTNTKGGVGSEAFGSMHATEINARYGAEEAVITDDDNFLIIKINRSALETSIYEATRYAWGVDPRRAAGATVILAVFRGIIKEVFIADKWLEATADNFPGRNPIEGKYGFIGQVAPDDIRKLYVGKIIPARYRRRGNASSFLYT